MKLKPILVAVAVMATLVSSCSQQNEATDNGKLDVYTSFYAMYDFAKEIGGDKVNITVMCPPGQEPHDYEPTAQEMAKLADADVFIYNGLGMEHWTESVADVLEPSKTKIVVASDGVTEENNHDPHIWLNPEYAYTQMENIAKAFMESDSVNADYYSSRLSDVRNKIDILINDYKTASEQFSKDEIIVSHDAYSHLCNTISVTQMPVNGIDNSEDPTPSRMAEIEEFITENNIDYIFTEPSGTSSVMETISNDTNTQILVLNPFESGAEDKGYFDVMYSNLDALKTVLN